MIVCGINGQAGHGFPLREPESRCARLMIML